LNPYDAAHQLAKALKQSNQYRNMLEAKKQLDKDQSASEMINDLRKAQLELQKQQLSGIEISQEQKDKVKKLSEIVNMNKTASNFLQAEYQFAVLMGDIQGILSDAVKDLFGKGEE